MNNANHAITLELPRPESRLRCIAKLVQRRWLSFYRDKSDLSITLLQPPLLALAFFGVFQKIVVTANDKVFQPLRDYLTPGPGPSILIFLAVLTAVWFGTSKAIMEIPNSQVLYQQERLSFLKDFDYLLATFISLALIVFLQVTLFAGTFHILFVFTPAWLYPCETGLLTSDHCNLPISGWDALLPGLLVKFTALLWLTALAAIAFAMLVSVFVKTRVAAVTTITFVMVIQLLLGGSIVKPVKDMSVMIQTVAYLIPSRWGLEAGIILFDKELYLNLPGNTQIDFSFADSGVLGSLRLGNIQSFISKVSTVTAMQSLPDLWIKALDESAKVLNLAGPPLSKEEQEYLNAWREHRGTSSLPVPERLSKEVAQHFETVVQDTGKTLINKVNHDQPLDANEDALWQAMIATSATWKLYRQPHALTTWMMLVGLTLGFLTVMWGSFTRLNRRETNNEFLL